jgi:nitronate monooxygenase
MQFKSFKIGKHIIDKPIIQGGMGVGISWDQLAGTVSKEGALGVISTVGTGYYQNGKFFDKTRSSRPNPVECNSKEALIEIYKNARKICGNKPLAANIMFALSGFKESVEAACEAGTDIIISGAGLPLNLPDLTKKYPDIALVPIVSSARALKLICMKWKKKGRLPDAVVVEGPKSGGHQGFHTIEECYKPENQLENIIVEVITEARKWGDFPIIAAGGIWDKNDIEYYLNQGCSAVQMGTRFVATHECDAPDFYKNAVVECTEKDIFLSGSPVGFPSRKIANKLTFLIEQDLANNITKNNNRQAPPIKCISNCVSPCDHGKGAKKVGFCIADRLSDTILENKDTAMFFIGSNGYKVKEIISVKALIAKLMRGEEYE